jgi:hypothetical protein
LGSGNPGVGCKPPSFRGVLGIEEALQITFVHEIPKRRDDDGSWRPPTGYPSVSPMFRMCVLGTPIDWSREPGFPVALGEEPHPDALAIEQAVLELAESELDISDVPLGLDALVGPESGPYFLDVDKLKSDVRFRAGELVTRWAILRDRPTLSERPRCKAVLGENGKPVVRRLEERVVAWTDEQFDHRARLVSRTPARTELVAVPTRNRGKAGYKTGAYSPLRWSPNPHRVVEERADYAIWRAALVWLTERLSRMVPDPTPEDPGRMRPLLSTVVVTGPTAAALPWEGEPDGGPQVLPDVTTPVPAPRVAPRRRRAALAMAA